MKFRTKYLWSVSFFNLVLKLVDLTIFVKYGAAIIINHSIVKEKL